MCWCSLKVTEVKENIKFLRKSNDGYSFITPKEGS